MGSKSKEKIVVVYMFDLSSLLLGVCKQFEDV